MTKTRRTGKRRKPKTKAVVVVSDTHCGCKRGLFPFKRFRLDDGGDYTPSPLQRKVARMWREFWDEFVPDATEGDPFDVVVNGDLIEGLHHRSVTPISHNIKDQIAIARKVYEEVKERCGGRLYVVRGTEAHGGASDCFEEIIAEELNAIPNEHGQFSRWELWKEVGKGLVHFAHHIGSTSSAAYESSALNRALANSLTEAGRWKNRAPDIIMRAHRHRSSEVRLPFHGGYITCCVTPCWQLPTGFVHKVAPETTCQFGGTVIRQGASELYTRTKIWGISRSRVE